MRYIWIFQQYLNFSIATFELHIEMFLSGPLLYMRQGGHTLWKTGKTGKMVKKKSLQGKIREFEILLKIREKSGNFKKSYLCKVKIFKFYSCSDVATGGFFLPYA